jgi:hypothetical protein
MGMSIRTINCGRHRRYVLMDHLERFWTGDGWTPDLRQALRHASILDAHQEYQRVVEEMCHDKPVRTFEASIKVRVFADQPFDVEALRHYLEQASRFSQDTERMGDGPVNGCLVLQKADYSELKEVPTAPGGPGSAAVPSSER